MQNHTIKTIDTALKSFCRHEPLLLRISGTCMVPLINDGAMIEVRNQHLYYPGDILIKRDGANQLIAHRLIGYYPRKGKIKYITKADNSQSIDASITSSQIIGKLTGGDCDLQAIKVPLKARLQAVRYFFILLLKHLNQKL